MSCAPVVNFRGTTSSRPPGWGVRVPVGIAPDNHNLRNVGVLWTTLAGLPRHDPLVETPTTVKNRLVYEVVHYTTERTQNIKVHRGINRRLCISNILSLVSDIVGNLDRFKSQPGARWIRGRGRGWQNHKIGVLPTPRDSRGVLNPSPLEPA